MSSNSSSQSGGTSDHAPATISVAGVVKLVAPTPPEKPPKAPFWKRTGFSLAYVGWTFLGFMVAQLIIFGILFGVQAAGADLEAINSIVFNTAANVIVYATGLAIIIGLPWLILKSKTSLTELGLQRLPHWKDFLWLIAGFVAYLILTTIITIGSRLLFPGADYDQAQETGFAGLTTQFEFILTFISLVVIAPIAEEVMFRGYLFGKLKKHAQIWVSILLSSLLFAVVHFQFNVGLDTFALAIVLSLLRVATGSIWSSIMLHMAKNGLAFYFLFVNVLPF